jgi:hypothetical protein
MRRQIVSICLRLVIALGLTLGGLGPVGAGVVRAPAAMSSMAMMPGMGMAHQINAKAHQKQMPCCGDDGCCIAGSCGLPLASVGSAQVTLKYFRDETVFSHAVRAGVTFAPLLRPPISV